MCNADILSPDALSGPNSKRTLVIPVSFRLVFRTDVTCDFSILMYSI